MAPASMAHGQRGVGVLQPVGAHSVGKGEGGRHVAGSWVSSHPEVLGNVGADWPTANHCPSDQKKYPDPPMSSPPPCPSPPPGGEPSLAP